MKQLDVNEYMALVDHQARTTSRGIAHAGTVQKNRTLSHIVAAVRRDTAKLREIGTRDVGRVHTNGHDAAFTNHLTLADRATDTMAAGLEQIAALPDPVGEISDIGFHPTDIQVGQMYVPLGVVDIIYRSRLNVMVDVATLYIKSGSATILYGGSEAIESNGALAALIGEGLAEVGLPINAVQAVTTTNRAAVGKLITMTGYIDAIVPRGGKSLIARLIEEARVPMVKHLGDIYYICIDADADIEKTVRVCDNTKTQRCASYNMMKTLLVSRGVAARALPPLTRIYQDKGIELRVCPATRATLEVAGFDNLKNAVEAGWHTEYLTPILSIRTVDGLDAAIGHISTYGSAHTDSVITENYSTSMRFLRKVDSANVMINVSARFTDGFEYGLGAEIGISNDKLHARDPVGLKGLTSLKYVMFGHSEIRT